MTVTNHKVAAVVTPSTPSAQDGAAADESHARENPQRQAHQTHRHEGILGLAGNAQQEIHLDHRDRGGEADQKRGAQARRPAMLVAVQADQGTRNEGQSQALCNFRPLQYEGHGVLPICAGSAPPLRNRSMRETFTAAGRLTALPPAAPPGRYRLAPGGSDVTEPLELEEGWH